MTPLRILIAHNSYQQRGGEDAVADDEAALLERYGHEVLRYTRDNHDVRNLSPFALLKDSLFSQRTVRDLNALIARCRPDVIHVHNTLPLLSPSIYWAAARHQIPIVQTLHNFRLLCPQAMLLRAGHLCEACVGRVPWRAVVHRCYRDSLPQSAALTGTLVLHRALQTYNSKVTYYIALNEFCRQKFIAGGLPAHKITVKPNFTAIDTCDVIDNEAAVRAGALYVGRLADEKGIDVLLEAAQLAPAMPINVIGTGPKLDWVKASGRVHALGWQEAHAIRSHMRRAAYLVMPSIWYENFPKTLVEAFACGLPVIASRLGALAELIEEGRTGLLFTPGSARELANAMQWADQHPEAMREMGCNAREEYRRRYTPEKNYQQLHEIYLKAVRPSSLIAAEACPS